MSTQRVQTIIIGAGQAGLSMGYHLAKEGVPFLILDANERVGDSWRKRWDSLKLFTPARFNGLDGMPCPGPTWREITKDEMGDYLESYVQRFSLPVETGVRVQGLSREGNHYLIDAGDRQYEAEHVVVAMASYQEPKVPSFARELRPDIVQMHSREYRNPAQLRDGPVLLVGAGNSGAEIARETVKTHPTLLSGPSTGEVPFQIDGFAARHGLLQFVFRRDLPPDPVAGHADRPDGPPERAEGHAPDPGQVEGPQEGRHRAAAARGGREGWTAAAAGWSGARGGEHHLVHRVRAGIQLDSPAGIRRSRAEARTRHRTR